MIYKSYSQVVKCCYDCPELTMKENDVINEIFTCGNNRKIKMTRKEARTEGQFPENCPLDDFDL